MSYRLDFSSCHTYDPGQPSITLSVRLSAGGRQIEDIAKLDTGASFCIFQREIGEALGLVVAHGEPMRIGTVTGGFEVFGHDVGLSALGVDVEAVIYFAAEYGFPLNVLGRHGWIERLRIGLVEYDGLLYLSHYDDPEE